MYFTVSWDISASEPRWSAINDHMYNAIKAMPHTHPMSTFYIVRATPQQQSAVCAILQKIAQNTSETIHFVISPILSATGWDGWLPQDKWDEIRRITGQ